MESKLSIFRSIILAAALGLSAFSAQAVPLNPGDTVLLPGTTVASEPQLAGVVLVDELNPFSFGGITGTVQQRIVRSSVDGTLDFYWRVMNDSTSTSAIGSFRIGGFVSPEYNANWRIDGTGDKAPDSAHRFTGTMDSYLNFNFNLFSTDPLDGLRPGQSSYFMFLDTSATDYAMTAVYDLTNMVQNPISGSFSAYSPTTVPEPATGWLLGAGLIGLAGMLSRRRKI